MFGLVVYVPTRPARINRYVRMIYGTLVCDVYERFRSILMYELRLNT